MWRELPALLLALLCLALMPLAASSEPVPEFRQGFKLLADLIPDVAGKPLENEHHNPLNGDALQRTDNGLMVWRKADNWTAFTNGSLTWISGPLGLQMRRNDERFDWEIEPAPTLVPTAVQPTSPESSAAPTKRPLPTATPSPPSSGIRSPDPAGEWVTSVSPRTKYYASRDNPYWKGWSAGNRVWFATERELLAAYPGRTRR